MSNQTSDMIDTAQHAVEQLLDFIEQNAPLLVLTGAGISTDSGIPDYRDPSGEWKVSPPVQHKSYVTSLYDRQRYWARSLVGWPVMQRARPNPGHHSLEHLRRAGYIRRIVTQNVDRLHQKAGSEDTIDLHGRADQVCCIACGFHTSREEMHEWCRTLNPDFSATHAEPRPDGDAALEIDFSGFTVPDCPDCGGILKTDVVYFGDTVPKERVESALEDLSRSRGLFCVGSSLMVYSGFRFNRIAHANGIRQASLTLGKTRADELLSLRLNLPISGTLERVVAQLGSNAAGPKG